MRRFRLERTAFAWLASRRFPPPAFEVYGLGAAEITTLTGRVLDDAMRVRETSRG